MTAAPAAGSIERDQVNALTRSFLARFFDNEITSGTNDLKESFFWLIAFLATPGLLFPMGMGFGWDFIARYRGLETLRLLSRADKTLYLGFAMAASGLVTAIVWSSLLVNRRDGLVLGGLPVRTRVIVRSKLLALLGYIALVIVAMHVLASVFFGIGLAARNTLTFIVWGIAAHFTASSLSSLFVFLCVLAAQGTVLVLLGPRGFGRVSGLLQLGLVTGIVLTLIVMPAITQAVVPTLAGLGDRGRPWILWTPPLWFLGVYESVLGTDDLALHALARTALVASGAVAIVAAVSYPLAYRRVMTDAVEHPGGTGRIGKTTVLARWLSWFLGRTGVIRATTQFFLATIGRVERHRFTIALAAGAALAWAVPTAVRWRNVSQSGFTPQIDLLALPLSTLTFLLVGLRIAASLPSDLPAGWIFHTMSPPRERVRTGLRRVMLALGVAPVVLVAASFYWWLWGPAVAVRHALLCLAVGALVTECLLFDLDAMPCASPWRPERANLRVWWPAYLLAFVLLAGAGSFSVSGLALWSLTSPVGYGILLVSFMLPTAGLRWLSSRRPRMPAEDTDTFTHLGIADS